MCQPMNTAAEPLVARPRAMAPARFSRSGQMVACLRQELLYSEKRPRDMLFAAIDRLLAERHGGGIMVVQLTREAWREAKLEGERCGYTFSNWSYAGAAVMKALLCSSSLIAPDGHPIAYGVTSHAAPVRALCDDYEDRAEAFLLEFLLRRMGDVTPRDHTALAHALFRQFDPNIPVHDLEDRVAVLLARLANRVTLDGNVYTVHDA